MSAHMPYMGPSAKVGGALGRASAAQGPGRDAGEERQALEAAAKEFESLLVNEMLKAMRKTVPKDGLTEQGFGEKIFTEMHDERLAQSMSKMGGLGLHRMLVDQLGGELAAGPRPGEMIHPLGAGDHRVSSDFGPRTHPIHGDRRMHGGVDLPAKAGADVLAAQGGEVVRSGSRGGYGLMIELKHPGGTTTRYAHLSRLDVQVGDTVRRGVRIGAVELQHASHDQLLTPQRPGAPPSPQCSRWGFLSLPGRARI